MSNAKDVATKENEVATIDIEKFADQGFENIDSKSLQLPFLKILGQLSPQVTAGDSKYIDAAKPGMIYNTVTDKLYDGNKGILVIPAITSLNTLNGQTEDKKVVMHLEIFIPLIVISCQKQIEVMMVKIDWNQETTLKRQLLIL